MTEANKDTLKKVAIRYSIIIGLGLSQFIISKILHTDWFLGNFIFDNPIVISTILWLCLADLFGTCEGWFEHLLRNQDKVTLPINEHVPFTLIRVIIWFFIYKYVGDLWSCLTLIAIFPFVHDGQYYTTRNLLQPELYPKKWFDNSDTSTSWFDKVMNGFGKTFSAWFRTILFVVGMCFLFYYNLNLSK